MKYSAMKYSCDFQRMECY